MSRVQLHPANIATYLNREDGPVGDILRQKGRQVELLTRAFVPVDHGELRDSIDLDVSRDTKGIRARIEAHAPHAIYVEMGTGLYGTGPKAKKQRIRSKSGGPLVFYIGGKKVFAMSIAGQHPQPFLRRALRVVFR